MDRRNQLSRWCNLNRTKICVVLAILIALVLTGAIVKRGELRVEAKVKKTQQDMAKEVFRFHVLANSDSDEDQALKMQVKETVIAYMKQELPDAKSAAETKQWAMTHEKEIESAALKVIKDAGYDYKATAKVTTCYFPDKTYGDVTFPAGDYEALRIEIGAAKGHNWWCVLYPNLCFVDATHAVVPEKGKQELQQVLTDDEYEMVTATTKFKIKWFFFDEKED